MEHSGGAIYSRLTHSRQSQERERESTKNAKVEPKITFKMLLEVTLYCDAIPKFEM